MRPPRLTSMTDLMLRAMAELFAGEGRVTDPTLREQFVASRILRAVEEAGPDHRFAYLAHNDHIQRTPVVFEGELPAYPSGSCSRRSSASATPLLL